MSYPRYFTPRSRWASRAGRWALLLLLAGWSSPAARAQPAASSGPAPAAPPAEKVAAPVTATAAAPATKWPWMLGLLVGGVALGVLGARLWARAAPPAAGPAPRTGSVPPAAPSSERKKPAENVAVRPPTPPARGGPGSARAAPARPPAGPGNKPNPSPKKKSSSRQVPPWPTNVPHRPAAMNPAPPPVPALPVPEPLETGQTVEWATPAPPPATRELLDAAAAAAVLPETPAAEASTVTALPAAAAGPVHYYAPAPDVPSIEHRKLSPQPLPQMPLLITLAHAEATTAQFSFSPQADQSRIIGNGVRELKEFFAFELPPTEQFTTIANLAPGQLEKRDDAWHVVQPASIALS